jgi:hypothetical protein
MSNRYGSIASIMAMLDARHTISDLNQALSDLKAMYEDRNITEYQYKNIKTLLEDKIRDSGS